MSFNNIDIANKINAAQASGASIHELISCENIGDLASKHSQLCNALYSCLSGGCTFEEVSLMMTRLIDQSEDIEVLLNLKLSAANKPSAGL